jgi:hypothetical protein
MTEDRHLEILQEMEEIENRVRILDPSNPIEREEGYAIVARLQELLDEVEEAKKQERLGRFQLIKNEEE